MQDKVLTFGHEGRLKIKEGIDAGANAVLPTLGPIGMLNGIEWPGLDPVEADDGITILKSLQFKDHFKNFGLQKLKKGALRTSIEAGDATATTCALTQAIVHEAFKEIANDSSKIREVRERLENGLVETINELRKIKRGVTDGDVERIAAISSLDPVVAKMIADIIKEVGIHGIVKIEKGSKIGYEKEIVPGAQFDRGYASEYFLNDRENMVSVLEKPYILLVDRRLSVGAQLQSVMDAVAKAGPKSLLIIADAIDGTALASLIQASKMVTVVQPDGKQKQGSYDICAVTNPFTASPGKEFLKDIAALTGATVVSEEAGMKLSECGISVLGRAEKVIITNGTTTIMGCEKNAVLTERITAIKSDIESTTSEYQKLMLNERLSRLDGGIGIIRVGTYTDTDYNEKKLKFDNAIRAAQSALQEGKLPGGGSALAKIVVTDPIFKVAILAPFKRMALNAGMEWHKYIATVQDPNTSMGVDFVSKKVVDMFDAGIIDSFKSTRIALESAVNTAISVIRYEVINTVEDIPKDK